MKYNHELESFFESFGRHILYSLCFNNRDLFQYKSGIVSQLRHYINIVDFPELFCYICETLVREGRIRIFYDVKNNENEKSMKLVVNKTDIEESTHGDISFEFPKSIMSENKRKRTIAKLALLDISQIDTSNEFEKSGWKFASEMMTKAQIEIGKVGKHFYMNGESNINFSDYYIVYRSIKQKIEQRKLLDYVLDKLNSEFVCILNLKSDDILEFKGVSVEKLNALLIDLKENTYPLTSIIQEIKKS